MPGSSFLVEIPQLGARGGGWVALQFALIAAILVLAIAGPGWPEGARWWLKGAGVALVFGGAFVVVSAARALGSSLTPFPRPSHAADIVEAGPYTIVRHPIYSGGILFFAGIALALSPWALVGTVALAVLWALKSRVEERLLVEHDAAYEGYRSRTRYRLVPFVY